MVLLRLLGSQKGYERSAWVVTVRLALQRFGVTTSSEGVNAADNRRSNGGAARAGEMGGGGWRYSCHVCP